MPCLDRYKILDRAFKSPVTIREINSHLRLDIYGNLYIGTLNGNEYDLDSREYDGTNSPMYTGLRFRFIPDKTNPSSSITVKIGSLPSVELKNFNGDDFGIGELKPNRIYTFEYDESNPPSVFKEVNSLTDQENEFDYYFYMVLGIVDYIEKFTRRDIFHKNYEMVTTDFYREMTLRRSPLKAVTAFKYYVDGLLVDVDPTLYQTVYSDRYSMIKFLADKSSPTNADIKSQNVVVNFTTGMFDTVSEVDASIKQAILIMMASLNQYRGDCIDSFNVNCFCVTSNIPPQAQAILRQYKIETTW